MLNRMLKISGIAFTVMVVFSLCSFAEVSNNQGVFTDLGNTGNAAVSSTFKKYKEKNPFGQCKGSSNKRVILTGFGLFSGVDYNISGTVMRSMANPQFFPSFIDTSQALMTNVNPTNGLVNSADKGAWGANRTLTIDGEKFDVCFLVLDVIWDLAAAIILYESNLFKPELVLMSGRGADQAIFEFGALNQAVMAGGFSSNGAPLANNIPQKPWVLKNYEVGFELPMKWDNQFLASSVKNIISSLGYSVSAPDSARDENDYICNNVSFAVTHGLVSPTELAGQNILIESLGTQNSISGFFHFPAVDLEQSNLSNYKNGVLNWARVIALTIKNNL